MSIMKGSVRNATFTRSCSLRNRPRERHREPKQGPGVFSQDEIHDIRKNDDSANVDDASQCHRPASLAARRPPMLQARPLVLAGCPSDVHRPAQKTPRTSGAR
jgi:hypothetical protein